MTTEQALAFSVLAAALALFASGRLRHDVVALAALSAVALFGLAPAETIFSGFGHPAVVTVAAVLIMSAVLDRSGAVSAMARALAPHTKGQLAHIGVLTTAVAGMSAFMNNVGALALMMPVALATAAEHNRPPAILLMPLAFAAILGGMTTLIGTPPNIIIAGLRAETAGEPFALFDFAPVGLVVAVTGVAFVALVGWRLIPAERSARDPQEALFSLGGYLTEVRIPEDSALVGQALREAEGLDAEGVRVLGVDRPREDGRSARLAPVGFRVLAAGDVLILRAPPEAIAALVERYGLEIAPKETRRGLAAERGLDREETSLVEAIVGPASPLVGRGARVIERSTGGAATLLALARQDATISGRLREQVIQPGDVALLQGAPDALRAVAERFRLLPLAERGLTLNQDGRPALALGLFVGAIGLAVSGVVSIGVAFIIAIVASVALGLIQPRDLYEAVDWPVIVLLGAMFPLGAALEATGATTLLAGGIVDGADALGLAPWGVLTVVLIATMFLSDVINNAATAVLMGGLAITIAERLGANPDAFLMAVAVGASCAFLTPIGHQCNTLVMGPGGYRFTDYWRMGLPLEVLIVLVSVPAILWVWPL